MSQPLHDLAFSCPAVKSLDPLLSAAATLTGTYVDCKNLIGPIQALVQTGVATGTPDASSVIYTLIEATDSSGTGAVAISGATATHTGAAVSQIAGQRSLQFVAVQAVISFTNGTSPKIPAGGSLVNPRIRSA